MHGSCTPHAKLQTVVIIGGKLTIWAVSVSERAALRQEWARLEQATIPRNTIPLLVKQKRGPNASLMLGQRRRSCKWLFVGVLCSNIIAANLVFFW